LLARAALVAVSGAGLVAAMLAPSAATARHVAGGRAATPRAAGPAEMPAGIGCVGHAPPPSGVVACHPAAGTPHFPLSTASVFQVRQLVQCGATMYAAGTFSQVIGYDAATRRMATFRRANVFSFSATRPFAVSGWNPGVNGEVNSIALSPDCSTAYLGGNFTKVHGSGANNIVQVSTTTGALNPHFAHNADRTVETLLYYHQMVLAGGFFTAINGSRSKFYVSLDAATGLTTAYLNLHISGHYVYTRVIGNRTRVYNQQLDHAGTRLLAEGDFTSVGGKPRQQIFMLALGKTSARVTSWTAAGFYSHCFRKEPFYLKAASWSVDDKTVYIATTGFHPLIKSSSGKRTGLCDVAAAYPATETLVTYLWRNYTGCDSLYATAAGPGAVYFGGHERWADNRDGCNKPGPGAIDAPGMVGLSPRGGAVVFDPTRSRGRGADDMLLTSEGLWIASDNYKANDMCGHEEGFAGICLLP
jgi:hypothetical protein